MVGERRGGDLLVPLGPRLQARPEELLRQRPGPDGHPEYLVRWTVLGPRDEEREPAKERQGPADGRAEHILMWLSASEARASCPSLLGGRAEAEGPPTEPAGRPGGFARDAGVDEASLREMGEDVRELVRRAARQLGRSEASPAASLLHTVHVLSAYASIGPLAGVFRDTGALDLLMTMLGGPEPQIRRSAGKMLRALAAHDAGSRAHVLLSLSQQDGIEQHMDFDSRSTLLELFAETKSFEEHCMAFEGISLPQIPGKVLFSLVKRYLCATSLLDQLSSGADPGSGEQGARAPSSEGPGGERGRRRRELEFSMAMGSLISELVRGMGWDLRPGQPDAPLYGFQPHVAFGPDLIPPTPAPVPHRRQGRTFRSPSDFSSCSGYAEYVQETLRPGMRVRMMEDYVVVGAGDEGEFQQSNDSVPPAQVLWLETGRTYCVHWHMLEILGPGQAAEEKAGAAVEKGLGGRGGWALDSAPPPWPWRHRENPCCVPYLQPRAPGSTDPRLLSRGEWWEILFFVKKLAGPEQQRLLQLVQESQGKEVPEEEEARAELSVPVELARKLVLALSERCRGATRRVLLSSYVYSKYGPQSGAGEREKASLGSPDASWEAPGPGVHFSNEPKPEAPLPAARSEFQLFTQLLAAEGLVLPLGLEETAKEVCRALWEPCRQSTLEQKVMEAVSLVQRSSSDIKLQLAGLHALSRAVQDAAAGQDHPLRRPDRNLREKLVKMLVELLTNQVGEKLLVALALRLLCSLMARPEWRLLFATEGGVYAVLACMREYSASPLVQQAGLAALKMLTGAVGPCEPPPGDSGCPSLLPPSDAQVIREIFASIGSAAQPGSESLLEAIPSGLILMLRTNGCSSAVWNGLLLLNSLMSNHQALREQLATQELREELHRHSGEGAGQVPSTFSLIRTLLGHFPEQPPPKRQQDPGPDLSGEPRAGSPEPRPQGPAPLGLGEEEDDLKGLLQRLRHRPEMEPEPEPFLLLLRGLDSSGPGYTQLECLRVLTWLLDVSKADDLPWHEVVEPCLACMNASNTDREVVQEVVRFLHRLASSNKDCAVVLCRLGAREALTKALAQPSAQLLLGPELRELLDHCQKQASLYGNLTTSILAGCIQLVLGQIEEHRRTQQPINIPFLDVFLRHLCQGSSEEVREDRCWKKVEVSSNPHRASKLTDHNPKTYWESNGSTGSHHITLHVRRGVLIRQLTMLVASEDSSYMPARVVVLGGDSAASLSTELNTVNVLPSASRVPLLENLTHFWPVIQIRIKRCQQGGIDTRVRGLELLGPKPTLWPLFREQLCRRSRLFYAVRAQAWSRDVTQDRTRLLRLFPRLNRALGHEQAFADRFLPDEEAGLALSRTCREALITPLVHSITRPGPDGLSPLAWLLDLYLDHREEARRARGRSAALASRVRRLSHLLVHVEAPPTPPPSPPPALPDQPNINLRQSRQPGPGLRPEPQGNSLRDLTRCWMGVVQEQVSRFLAVAWKAPDFVPRFCGAFQRLQTAGTELFGACQAGFVLALRQGFAAALQQLPFLTASHVSEQFAHYIDELIQAGRVGSAESLEQLQQSLEPFLVLSGLELATSFEHFYRYYLGERLLGPGPCWLEEAVLDQIGLCFPNRLPQQMLSGLRAAAELQRHFRLFRLQQFDRRLLERGQEEGDGDDGEDWGPEAEPPGKPIQEQPEEEEEEETAEEEQSSPEMRVLVLSPRCWPVSPLCYMHEPSKYLPQALSGYLGRFSDFYSHGQSQPGPESGPRRRLQWTWLGWAELVFGAQQRLLVSTLQMWILLHFNEAQEVTVETLLQSSGLALELLTQALGPLTSSPGPLTLHEAEGLPAEGVLRLREEATDGTEPPGPPLRLLPPKAYLSMEEDQGRALEKKRNLLSCLLVRILKTRGEGGLHVDHLVCLVLEAWKETAPPGGGFCSNADVLSCILHLLGQGYMRRREEQPQVLVYAAPEPTGPSQGLAHIPFCGGSRGSAAGTVTLRPEEAAVLSSLRLPVGRTMSSGEVEGLMRQTVLQVQETLSLEPDVALHLLAHCRWGADALLQCYSEDPEPLLRAAGLRVPPPQHPPPLPSHCPVCVGPLDPPDDHPPTLCCLHYCCQSCWNEYLTTRIEQNLALSCTCPIAACPAQPTSAFVRAIVSSPDAIAKYEKALLRDYVDSCSNLTWCTNPQGCDRILCQQGLGCGAACAKCGWASCFNCNFPEAHYPASCSHMSQWVDDGGYYEGMSLEAQSKHLAKLISKRCPSCHAPIEKNEGCLHMTCAKCNHGFCWRCLKPWKPTHKDYYNCSAKVCKAARQEKRFQDYNEKCTFHHQAREFTLNLQRQVATLSKQPPHRSLAFLTDACKSLEQARKVLAYACVYSYYNQDTERMDVVEQQTESLERHTDSLQILLEETLLPGQDLASSLQLFKTEHLSTGLELLWRIQERLLAILQHSTQDFRVGLQSSPSSDLQELKRSNVPPGGSQESPTPMQEEEEEEEEEYVPHWHQYDEEELDEDNFYDDDEDDESDNLEPHAFFFDDEDEGYD
ncbi:cullin-9 [Ornithorhynchus anatinus]|uniref:cullin-9 n=1 Tax=Ornithorhynchus anatinus TaxID=9258 RepID=UPI0010A82DC1|nr:cullin-9 [Ornithorhynchus anatinus]